MLTGRRDKIGDILISKGENLRQFLRTAKPTLPDGWRQYSLRHESAKGLTISSISFVRLTIYSEIFERLSISTKRQPARIGRLEVQNSR